MKRDVDLERKILLTIEKEYSPGDRHITIELKDQDCATVYEHAKLLYQDGFIQDFLDESSLSGPLFFVGNLTSKGFDYVESIRKEGIWQKTKEVVKDRSLPMITSVLQTIASALAQQAANAAASQLLS